MPFGPRSVQISFGGDSITHFGGVLLLHQFFRRLGVRSLLARHVRVRQRNSRYAVSESLLALLYPIIIGLGRLDATRLLQHNGAFQFLTGLPVYPDPQTLRRFLVRFGHAGLGRFVRLHDQLRIALVQRPRRGRCLIFDWDTTVLTVYGKREGAAIGYNPKKHGRPSYLALLCVEGQTRDCWEASYHPGNTHPGSVIIPALERAFAKVPDGVRTVRVRADQAFYDREVVEFLEAKRAFYAIPARLYAPVKTQVLAARYRRVSAGVEAAEFSYQPFKWPGPRRFVVIRRPAPEEPSWQLTLWRHGRYVYQVIVTNLGLTPLHVWRFYNDRSQAELVIRELKEGYAVGKVPTGSWAANVAYFQLVVFAYNALNWFKRFCVAAEWQRLTLQTLRHRLLLIPAELIRPQGKATLKMSASYPHQSQFRETLKRIARFRFNLNPAQVAAKPGS